MSWAMGAVAVVEAEPASEDLDSGAELAVAEAALAAAAFARNAALEELVV